MNDLVTFYYIQTFRLNSCNPKLYNGLTPIGQINPDFPKNLFTMVKLLNYLFFFNIKMVCVEKNQKIIQE